MEQIPGKIDPQRSDVGFWNSVLTINEIIDYLHELTARIDTIAGNQLEMSRGRVEAKVVEVAKGMIADLPLNQPKRWRASLNEEYFYVTSYGHIQTTIECNHDNDLRHYLIGNYHQTREQAAAHKARLLELGKEI